MDLPIFSLHDISCVFRKTIYLTDVTLYNHREKINIIIIIIIIKLNSLK